jgi:hypothetical protein
MHEVFCYVLIFYVAGYMAAKVMVEVMSRQRNNTSCYRDRVGYDESEVYGGGDRRAV